MTSRAIPRPMSERFSCCVDNGDDSTDGGVTSRRAKCFRCVVRLHVNAHQIAVAESHVPARSTRCPASLFPSPCHSLRCSSCDGYGERERAVE